MDFSLASRNVLLYLTEKQSVSQFRVYIKFVFILSAEYILTLRISRRNILYSADYHHHDDDVLYGVCVDCMEVLPSRHGIFYTA